MTAKNNGMRWSKEEVSQLRKLAKGDTPTRIIALKMGRTPGAVESKAQDLNVSLKPVNQSPYSRIGK